MFDAKEEYKLWKLTHRMDLRVYTDEQMFEIGFNWRNPLIKELADTIEQLEAELKKAKNAKTKLPKADSTKPVHDDLR